MPAPTVRWLLTPDIGVCRRRGTPGRTRAGWPAIMPPSPLVALPRLPPGSLIAVVAPAGPADTANRPLPLGAMALLETDAGSLTFSQDVLV